MSWSASISRRSFLRGASFSAGMLAVSRLRPVGALAAAPAAAGGGESVLSARESGILTAIAERIVDTGDPDMPAFGDTGALDVIDSSLLYLDDEVRSQFRWALTLFEYGPPLFQLRLARFSSLSPEERDAHIEDWRDSRLATRRLIYRAVKNLSFLGYYSEDATWKGIHYGGPWVPRPRRPRPRAASS